MISKFLKKWQNALLIIKPETLIKWHRKGFRIYWKLKSKRKTGRKAIPQELKDLILKMSVENPTWGAPRIRAELKLLGYKVAISTVAKYMNRKENPPSQKWKTFLKNHAHQIAGIDFFTVPTINFQILYCFIILLHGNRKLLHFNVTSSPGQSWTNLQIKQAFPYDTAPNYIIHDRASVFRTEFQSFLKGMGIESIKIGYRMPVQNALTERVIGTIRRDCLDHMIVMNENHLRKVMKEFIDYYNNSRTHYSLYDNSPVPREVQLPEKGDVKSISFLGGLHHRYYREAA